MKERRIIKIGILALMIFAAASCDLVTGSGSAKTATLETGTGATGPVSWLFFRGNSRGTGSATEIDTSTNKGTIQWSTQISDLDSSTLYYANFISGEALGVDGSIYVASSDPGNTTGAELTKLDADGNILWKWPKDTAGDITGEIRGTPVIAADGTIYVGSIDGHLYAVDTNGIQQWRINLGGQIWAAAAIGTDGMIYAGTASLQAGFYAINPDGTEKWSYDTGGDVMSSANFAADGTIYVRVFDGKLIALNPDGTEKWTFDNGVGGSGASPVVAPDGTIYFGDFESYSSGATFYALNPDGTKKWSAPVSEGVGATPVVGPDGTIYVGTWAAKVHAFNPDGTEKWTSMGLANAVQSSPALSREGTLYAAVRDSNLFAFDTDDGSVRWFVRVQPGAIVAAPLTIGDDGTVYVHGNNGVLYGVKN